MLAIPTVNGIHKFLVNNCNLPLLGICQTKFQTSSCQGFLIDPYLSTNFSDSTEDFDRLHSVKHLFFLRDGLTDEQIETLKNELVLKFMYDAPNVRYVKKEKNGLLPMEWKISHYEKVPPLDFLKHEEEVFLQKKLPYVDIEFITRRIPTLMSFSEILGDLDGPGTRLETKCFLFCDMKFNYNPIRQRDEKAPEYVDGVTFKASIPNLKFDKERFEEMVKKGSSYVWGKILLKVGIRCENGYKIHEFHNGKKQWYEKFENEMEDTKDFLEMTFKL
jgi:hypothetical protein